MTFFIKNYMVKKNIIYNKFIEMHLENRGTFSFHAECRLEVSSHSGNCSGSGVVIKMTESCGCGYGIPPCDFWPDLYLSSSAHMCYSHRLHHTWYFLLTLDQAEG